MKNVSINVLICLCFWACCSSVVNATNYYTGTVDGDWMVASNWSTAVLPVSGEQVKIGRPAIANGDAVCGDLVTPYIGSGINMSGGTLTVSSMWLGSTGTNSYFNITGGAINPLDIESSGMSIYILGSDFTINDANAVVNAYGIGYHGTYTTDGGMVNLNSGTLNIGSSAGTANTLWLNDKVSMNIINGILNIRDNNGNVATALEGYVNNGWLKGNGVADFEHVFIRWDGIHTTVSTQDPGPVELIDKRLAHVRSLVLAELDYYGDFIVTPQNANFENDDNSDGIPDSWSVEGSGAGVSMDSSIKSHGTYSAKLVALADDYFLTQTILQVVPNETYCFSARISKQNAGGTAKVELEWYDASDTLVRTDSSTEPGTSQIGQWVFCYADNVTSPLTASYVKLKCYSKNNTVYFDDIEVRRNRQEYSRNFEGMYNLAYLHQNDDSEHYGGDNDLKKAAIAAGDYLVSEEVLNGGWSTHEDYGFDISMHADVGFVGTALALTIEAFENEPEMDEIITINNRNASNNTGTRKQLWLDSIERAVYQFSFEIDLFYWAIPTKAWNQAMSFAETVWWYGQLASDSTYQDHYDDLVDDFIPYQNQFGVLPEGKYPGGDSEIGYDAYIGVSWMILFERYMQTKDPRIKTILLNCENVLENMVVDGGMLDAEAGGRGSSGTVSARMANIGYRVADEIGSDIFKKWLYMRREDASGETNALRGGHFPALNYENFMEASDNGYVFPRMMSTWSSKLYDLNDNLVRSYPAIWTAGNDEMTTNHYRTEYDFPEVVGIPMTLELTGSNVAEVECIKYEADKEVEFKVTPASDGLITYEISSWPESTYLTVIRNSAVVAIQETDSDGKVSFTTYETNGQTGHIIVKSGEPVTVFSDNFELAANWTSEWSDYGAWNRVTARKYDGSYGAEIDGNVTDSALISRSIDVTGKSSATITFWWYIENSIDAGEYLAFDTDTGSGWVQKADLQGNVDAEDTWVSESIVLDVSSTNALALRFRGKMSRSNEGAYVDVVEVIAH